MYEYVLILEITEILKLIIRECCINFVIFFFFSEPYTIYKNTG